MRIIKAHRRQEIKQVMLDIGVDPYGIEIMLPKATHYLVRVNSISNIAANILKQEMLSLGADVAVSRDALTGKKKTTDALLIGNLSQFIRLKDKLAKQPFGLHGLGENLSSILDNYRKEGFSLDLGKYKLGLKGHALLMGIVNLTPDSFSGDGLLKVTRSQGHKVTSIVDFVQKLVHDGADIIDVGGESSRPGANPVPVKEELARVIPVIKVLAKKIRVPISVDTSKPEVAKQALDHGAVIVNDITALRKPKMAKLVAGFKAAVVLMHMKGSPGTMQKNPRYVSLIDEITQYLDGAIRYAESAGISKERIIVDPGIGFGKLAGHNLEILRRLDELKVLGKPLLVGTSRKAFIGTILNGSSPGERLSGTISSCILAVKNGAKILRVHDVLEVRQALSVLEAIEKA